SPAGPLPAGSTLMPAKDGAPASAGPSSVLRAAIAGVPSARLAPSSKFFVQVGAFGQVANATELLGQLEHIGQDAHIDSGSLFRVRIGPFDTREQAIAARGRLEGAGMSAIVVAQ